MNQVAAIQMTRVQQAKSRLLLKNVFFSALLMGTPLRATDKVPIAATDMREIFFNPDYLEKQANDVVTSILLHELLHIVLKHGLRRGGRNPKKWNVAADFAVNQMIADAGFTLWAGALLSPQFRGKSAEHIYDELPDLDGSGRGPSDENGPGEDLLEPGALDPDEVAEIEDSIAQRVAQAATQARMAGQMTADLERLVNGILNPELPWEALLAAYMNQFCAEDESWTRRNRRISQWVFPGRQSVRMGELVVIGDTSGSIGDNVFARVAAELNYIKASVRPSQIRVVWADDAECSRMEIFQSEDELQLHPKGGGGTDMRKPLRFVEQFDPMVVILITDCYTPWPDQAPPYPLLVLSTTDEVAPIGETIKVTVA